MIVLYLIMQRNLNGVDGMSLKTYSSYRATTALVLCVHVIDGYGTSHTRKQQLWTICSMKCSWIFIFLHNPFD